MNTSTDTCPSLEDLAAFLDGKLSGHERARVVTHLADCPRCYEVFAESARFQLYEEEEGEEKDDDEPPETVEVPQELVAAEALNKVVPFPRTQVFRWVSSIAAVLVVSLAAIPLYRQYYTIPEMRSAQLANPAVVGETRKDEFWDQWTTRGEEEGGIATDSHESLIGAHAVDLRRNLARNNRQEASNDLARINWHVKQLGLLVPEDQAKAFLRLQGQLEDGKKPIDLIPEADKVEANLIRDAFSLDISPYFAFGKWLEAGRLSALAETPDFFQDPKNRKFLRAFLHHEVKDLDPEVARTLGDIQETLDKADPSSLPYKDLERQFKSILTYYQEESLNSDLG